MREVMLYTGGMDSYMSWRLLGEPPILYIDAGHEYAKREIKQLYKLHPKELITIDKRIDLADVETASGWVPLRNAFFFMIGALSQVNYSVDQTEENEPIKIYLNALKGEGSTDKSRWFRWLMSKVMSLCLERKVICVAPYHHLYKAQLVQKYLKEFTTPEDLEALKATTACYREKIKKGFKGCGVCWSCYRRWAALYYNGIEERYEVNPWELEIVKVNKANVRKWIKGLSRKPITYWIPMIKNNYYAYSANKKARRNDQ
tara:strand:- start:1790 stop:2566 length:777 start_codon:yes stop_codon:yes gene_type:complete